jgi:hypothetical protein
MFASVDARPPAPGRRIVAIGAVVFTAVAFSGLGIGAGVATAAPSAAKSKAEVKANWLAFFSAKTPAARRIKLLQNGQEFAAVIREASKDPLAATLAAKVSKVTVASKTKADVTYSLVLGGQPVLSHQKGTSVYQGGQWKVGDSSFCSLLTLEAGGKTSSLPKACRAGK